MTTNNGGIKSSTIILCDSPRATPLFVPPFQKTKCKILGAQHSFKRRSQKIRLTSVRDIGDKAPFDKAPLASSPVCL
ncbi:hypothetical protein QL285_046799 [Trifolium repens]|nr:hypothetical protein QL285_046799 [Trifolium repens]